MHLYNVTLQPASAISTAVLGHFRGSKTQELAVARHERLELWDASPTTGRLTVLSTQPLFAAIRSLAAFRVAGSGSTHLALTCDNGAVSILAYDHSAGGRFRVVQHHEFARSGLRRSAAGEYVAADPRGRALMVAGVERSRLVYVVARDAQGEVQVASPLDGSRSGSAGGAVCLCVVGVDVGYENPAFAALEAGAAGCEVAWYEVDLGLNHVVRRWSCAVAASAGRLVALPGDDGPSGVLVCSAGLVEWVAPTMAGARVRAHIPRRADDPRPVQLVAHAVHRMRQAFFILAQGTLGDLYKVTVAYAGAQVTGLHVAYFDTLPGCASALCILRAGFLFAACGADGGGAHRLLQFADLGDESGGQAEGETFVPHDGLRSLAPVDELECPAPVVRARMLNLAQELAPQMYALGGRTGAHPALRIVRRAADALELAASELPARALHVFRAHPWVAVSFARHTLVLHAASDGALQEASEHPLATDHQTLALCALPGAALLQATSAGLVLAPSVPGARRFEWAAAGGVSAAALAGATALVVDGGCARVLDVRPGEISERPDAIDAAECVALSPVDPGQRAPRFAAVGCSDGSVRVYLLGAPGSPIALAALQALSEAPASVAMARIAGQMLLFVGLPSGVLVRARVDEVSGELSSVRSRFLGPHAVLVRALDGVLVALAPQPWVCHAVRGRVTMTPLAYDALDDVAPLEVDGVERALVAVAQGSLRVLALDRLDSPEGSVAAIPLSLTPRIMHAHASGHFAVVEAEHRAQWAHATAGEDDDEGEYAVSRTCEEASWAALVRVVNAFDGSTTHVEKLTDSWTVVSMTTVTFASTVPDQNQNLSEDDAPPLYLALGCARNMRLRPRSCEAAEIRLFRWSADGRRLLHVHTTPLDDIPQALVCLAGHLVVAQGPALRVYAMGRRQLLKRAHAIVAPHMVTLLEPATAPSSTVDSSSSSSAAGLLPQRLLVADVQESVMLVEYSPATHAFCVLVADSVPRYLTVLSMLDEHTVAAGDKFGNLCVLRVPERAQRYIDPSAAASSNIVAVRPTDPVLWDALCEYHVGDPLTMLQPCALAPAARSVLTYATLRGALMAAVPLPARRDIDLLVRLELAMRELLELPVRDHIKYRSSFMPVKAVVDGDLCEMFDCLELHVRENVAQSLDRSVDDISKKLHDLRSQYTFG